MMNQMIGLLFFNYHNDARSNTHNVKHSVYEVTIREYISACSKHL